MLYPCSMDAASKPAPQSVDAGTVTVTAAQTLALTRDIDGYYADVFSGGTLFDPGQAIEVDIQGHGLDPMPFATSLVGPGSVTLLSPTGSPIVVDRADGITLSWTPTTGDYLVANIGTYGDPAYVSCVWPISAGQGLVPASVLEALTPGSASLIVESESLVDQLIGEWRYLVFALVQTEGLGISLQ